MLRRRVETSLKNLIFSNSKTFFGFLVFFFFPAFISENIQFKLSNSTTVWASAIQYLPLKARHLFNVYIVIWTFQAMSVAGLDLGCCEEEDMIHFCLTLGNYFGLKSHWRVWCGKQTGTGATGVSMLKRS